ncbi:MAG: hypothetical protein JXC85_00735 [Candidatus Aenigmarchaeota archaeon]|nr:hypothetical protein [Candidatus Aenigmarchaeota archaeon]
MRLEDVRTLVQTRTDKIREVLESAEKRDLPTPAPEVRKKEERQNLLAKHLLDGSPVYTNMVEIDLLRQDWRDSGYDRNKFGRYVEDNPEMAADILIEEAGTEGSEAQFGTAKFKELWREFYHTCGRRGIEKPWDRVAEWLYTRTRSARRRELDEILADSVGMACMSGTLGVVTWDNVSEKVKRSIYRDCARRYLK